MLEKAPPPFSTCDLHSNILAKLYSNLIQNGELNYYEHTLLANISSLSDLDFKYFYNLIKDKPNNPITTQDDCIYTDRNFIKDGITHLGANNGKKIINRF